MGDEGRWMAIGVRRTVKLLERLTARQVNYLYLQSERREELCDRDSLPCSRRSSSRGGGGGGGSCNTEQRRYSYFSLLLILIVMDQISIQTPKLGRSSLSV
jgi:hypothetical protein